MAAGSCANPVFEHPEDWGADSASGMQLKQIKLGDTPAPFPDGATLCRAYESRPSCCTNATLAAIEDSFGLAKRAVKIVRSPRPEPPRSARLTRRACRQRRR